jgi:predicted RNA-binding Zn-ribbon protein involved in translation (DUF1610 family)
MSELNDRLKCNQFTVIKPCPKCGELPMWQTVENKVFGRTYFGRCRKCDFECNCGSSTSDVAVLNWNCEVEEHGADDD